MFRIMKRSRTYNDWIREAKDSGLINCPIHSRKRAKKFVKPGDTVFNWGVSNKYHQPIEGVKYINHPDAVEIACNKLKFLNRVGILGVPFTVVPSFAKSAGLNVARYDLTGSQGAGIKILNPETDEYDAPLFTKYIKGREVRVIIAKNKEALLLQKRKRNGVPANPVKNHGNGYVYCINKVDDDLLDLKDFARECLIISGLDFAAFDIIMSDEGIPYVLEANTAFGVKGESTKTWMNEFILECINAW